MPISAKWRGAPPKLVVTKPTSRKEPRPMISRGEDVEVQALKKRGWSIAAISRHLGRDPKTIRAYLNGQREPGVRRSSKPDPLQPYTPYLTARFADNAHLWASALYDEVVPLGYAE